MLTMKELRGGEVEQGGKQLKNTQLYFRDLPQGFRCTKQSILGWEYLTGLLLS